MGINLFFTASSEIFSAKKSGMARNWGMPYIIAIPKILKSKWLIAATRAATVPVSAAKSAVTVVPILAPRVKGNIFFNVNTPAPASGTTNEVVIDELCTIIVRTIPKPIARRAVLKIYWSKNYYFI